MWIWMEIEVLDVWFKKWDFYNYGELWDFYNFYNRGVSGGLDDIRMVDIIYECI